MAEPERRGAAEAVGIDPDKGLGAEGRHDEKGRSPCFASRGGMAPFGLLLPFPAPAGHLQPRMAPAVHPGSAG